MGKGGGAKIKPKNPRAILLPYQTRWVKDRSLIKLMEKSRQIGATWVTAFSTVINMSENARATDCWVSSRDELQAKLFIRDCQYWVDKIALIQQNTGNAKSQKTARPLLMSFVSRMAGLFIP